MFKELIESVTKERNNLVDKCTRNLIELAGFKLSKNYSEFEIVMLIDDMRKQGYKIEYKSGNDSKYKIILIKMEDLHEFILAGYAIDIVAEENKVSIVASYYSE